MSQAIVHQPLTALDPWSVNVGFVVDELSAKFFYKNFDFPLQVSFRKCPNAFICYRCCVILGTENVVK
jgi:hypothetical protein